MTRTLAPSTLALSTLALLACGEPLQEAAYRGEPEAVYVAVLDQILGSSFDPQPNLRATVVWSIDDDAALVQHPGLSVPVEIGAEIRLVLYRRPPAVARARGYALGKFVLYQDTDGDGIKDPDEDYVTGPSPTTLYWSPAGLTAADGPTTLPIPAGYQVVFGWPPCGGPYEVAPADASCDVPIGEVCETLDACGAGGECVRTVGAFDVAGVCAAYAAAGCVPPDTRRVPFNPSADNYVWRWDRVCTVDADCSAVQACARATGTCALRADDLRLELRPAGSDPEVCRDDQTTFDGVRR